MKVAVSAKIVHTIPRASIARRASTDTTDRPISTQGTQMDADHVIVTALSLLVLVSQKPDDVTANQNMLGIDVTDVLQDITNSLNVNPVRAITMEREMEFAYQWTKFVLANTTLLENIVISVQQDSTTSQNAPLAHVPVRALYLRCVMFMMDNANVKKGLEDCLATSAHQDITTILFAKLAHVSLLSPQLRFVIRLMGVASALILSLDHPVIAVKKGFMIFLNVKSVNVIHQAVQAPYVTLSVENANASQTLEDRDVMSALRSIMTIQTACHVTVILKVLNEQLVTQILEIVLALRILKADDVISVLQSISTSQDAKIASAMFWGSNPLFLESVLLSQRDNATAKRML